MMARYFKKKLILVYSSEDVAVIKEGPTLEVLVF